MSTLLVDQISNKTNDGAATFSTGLVVSSGYALTCSGGMNVGGALTATSFVGNGSALTNIPGLSNSKAVAFKLIFSYNETFGT